MVDQVGAGLAAVFFAVEAPLAAFFFDACFFVAFLTGFAVAADFLLATVDADASLLATVSTDFSISCEDSTAPIEVAASFEIADSGDLKVTSVSVLVGFEGRFAMMLFFGIVRLE